MILARLQGGLGNQLFQYAAAKALAMRLNKPFKLEIITSLKNDKLRHIALHNLQATFELATKKEVKEFVYFPSLYRHRPAFFSRFGKNIYRERHFPFNKQFFQIKDPVFLDGFFQSEQYFKNIESIIRADFTVKQDLITTVLGKARELENRESIGIHIRRGDFLNPKATAFHGVLDTRYYKRAIELLLQRIPGASLHVFSDDKTLVENMPVAANAEFISSYTKSPIEDFYLMTKCRHNIIANSSFSWWAAWLNNNPDKIVVAPKNWFADDSIDTSDLIPSAWMRV